ncbi:MAG: DeoR/GlpR family DNA-binding transcription regulator [Eubacteriales bacterium]|nr:DeoR/GlpR family DNA-binding transcription regulator [Eubacteriales bacterium]
MNNIEHKSHYDILPDPDMLPAERQRMILEQVKKSRTVKVHELSAALFINEATIRRDLNVLEKEGHVKRIYGGAVLASGPDSELPFAYRQVRFAPEKKRIAERAAREVENGDTIFLDSSSTVAFMIPYLEDRKGLRIVTNGAKTVLWLASLTDAVIISTGGTLRENSLSFAGQNTHANLSEYFFDKVFFSCHAFSTEHGLMDSNEDEARLRKLIVSRSRKAYLLADSSKEGKTSFYKICDMDSVVRV